jgi:hypothetical protein
MRQRLTVLAVPGVDDHDVGTAVTGHELLAAELVYDDHVCLGEVLHSTHCHQTGITRTRADEDDTTGMTGCRG